MKRKHWKLLGFMVLAGVIVCAVACAGKHKGKETCLLAAAAKAEEAERKVTEAEVPAAALATLKKLARGAEITEFAEEIEHGSTFYEGSWKNRAGASVDVLVTKAGDLVEIEKKIAADKVPAAVLKAAKKAAGKGAQLSCEKKTMILYEIKFTKAGARHELLLTPDGRCVEQEVEKGKHHEDEDEEEEEEEEVSIGEVPRVVKATILKHAAGGEIEEIERETKDDKVIYEVVVIIGDKELELKVAADGKLLSKEVEDEDEDEEDEDEDN